MSNNEMISLQRDYPWIRTPTVACAPMRLIALANLAFEVSRAGGVGFIGAGSDVSSLDSELVKVKTLINSNGGTLKQNNDVLPVGVGFLLWAGDKLLKEALPILQRHRPAAVWLFAPNNNDDLTKWTKEIRRVSAESKIWIQVGTVANAMEVTRTCKPDVLVVQGSDAGGHGLQQSSGIISLFPEVDDALNSLEQQEGLKKPKLIAAGGIVESRGAAAALSLGASGVVMGTRYLATPEAQIQAGYRNVVVETTDGGKSTARTHIYDQLRGTTDWPSGYGGRGILNQSFYDAQNGMSLNENKRQYEHALKKGDGGWGPHGRLTGYAGTAVGLVNEVKGAAAVTEEVREGAKIVLKRAAAKL
jgi:nitronate monooxygenase